MPSTPVGEALKNTRLGRLKYSTKDWSDPANIKELLNKCRTESRLESGLTEDEISIIENNQNCPRSEGLASPLADNLEEESIFDNFNNAELNRENNLHINQKQKSCQQSVYENDLIFYKLRWDQELKFACENRLRSIQEKHAHHMKLLKDRTNFSFTTEDETPSPNVLTPENERFSPVQNAFPTVTQNFQDDSNKSSPRRSSSTDETNLKSVLPSLKEIEESKRENRSPDSIQFSDQLYEAQGADLQVQTQTNERQAEDQRLNRIHIDEFVRVRDVIRHEIQLLDEFLNENAKNFDNSNESLVKHASEVRSMIEKKLKILTQQVEEMNSCDENVVRHAKELEKNLGNVLQMIFKMVEKFDQSPSTSYSVQKAADTLSQRELDREESAIEIDVSPAINDFGQPAAVAISIADAEPAAEDLGPDLEGHITPDGWALYNSLMEHLHQTKATLSRFKDDESLKKYRNKIHSSASTHLNTIGASNFKENLTKLQRFLDGDDDDRLIRKHEKALLYCLDLIAERLIKQAEVNVSNVSNVPLFNAAAAAVALCCKFSQLRNLILAHLFIRCPFLVPYNIKRKKGQSDEDWMRALGFDMDINVNRGGFLKRIVGMTKFFVALTITPTPPTNYFTQRSIGFNLYQSQSPANQPRHAAPFGLRMCWQLLASVGNLKPVVVVTAAVLLEILQTGGYFMKREYKDQFVRILAYFKNIYMPMIKTAHSDVVGLAYLDLENLFKKPSFSVPSDFLGENIWNSNFR